MVTGSLPRTHTGFLSVSFLPDQAAPWVWRLLCLRHGSRYTAMQQQTVGTIAGRRAAHAGIQLDEGLLFDDTLSPLLGSMLHTNTSGVRQLGQCALYAEGHRNPDKGAQFTARFVKSLPVNTTIAFVGDAVSLQMIDVLMEVLKGTATASLFPNDQTLCMIDFSTGSNGDPVIKTITKNPFLASPSAFTPDELKMMLGIS